MGENKKMKSLYGNIKYQLDWNQAKEVYHLTIVVDMHHEKNFICYQDVHQELVDDKATFLQFIIGSTVEHYKDLAAKRDLEEREKDINT